jgi:two-component system, sensor histidine kinase and response regulator
MYRSRESDPVVLVIDDHEQNIRLVGQVLATAGYDIAPALSGHEGIELALASPPDLILLDMRMPGFDGFSVLAALREVPSVRDVPVIFLTANADRDSLIRAFSSGAVDYIVKPFVADELIARVRAHIELKLARDRLGQR